MDPLFYTENKSFWKGMGEPKDMQVTGPNAMYMTRYKNHCENKRKF